MCTQQRREGEEGAGRNHESGDESLAVWPILLCTSPTSVANPAPPPSLLAVAMDRQFESMRLQHDVRWTGPIIDRKQPIFA
jgi:hypothetical protein